LKSETVYKDKSTINRNDKEWYENGKIKSEIGYKNDKMHGKIRRWYENGQKESECDYFEGKLHGKLIFWDENGQLKSIMEFKNGNITRHSIFKDGKMIRDNYPQKKKKK
jgi:antitoxin component YwqK of YwqJK toxin-antitoxin module